MLADILIMSALQGSQVPVSETENATSPTLDSFTLFHQLPTELRLKIWRHALPGPRVVEIHYIAHIDGALSSIATPTVLLVCLKSNQEGSKCWK
jgi:hypothetical protein